jgi:hypothetical protein
MRRGARLINTRRMKDFAAVAVCIILSKATFESNAVIISLPQAAIDLV